eukprot:2996384-Pyramimonas_sp.AAC.1
MSFGRSRELIKHGSACLTEKSLVYLAHMGRLAHGVEHLMMMGSLVGELLGPQPRASEVAGRMMEFSS